MATQKPLSRSKVLAALEQGTLGNYRADELAWRMPPRPSARDVDLPRAQTSTAPEKGYDQVWTHPSLLPLVFETWGIAAGRTFTAYDPAVGSGAAWVSFGERARVTGIELDAEVAAVANVTLKKGLVLAGELATYRPFGLFDVAGGAPPYRIMTLDRSGQYLTAGAAGYGPSHGFYIEQCLTAVREDGLVFLVLPRQWHRQDAERPVLAAAKKLGTLVARFELPPGATTANEQSDLYVFSRARLKDARCAIGWSFRWDTMQSTLTDLLSRESASSLRQAIERFNEAQEDRSAPVGVEPLEVEELREVDHELPFTDTIEVRVVPNGGRVQLVPNGAQAAARLAQIDRGSGRMYDARRQEHTTRWRELLREPFEYSADILVDTLRGAGIEPVMTDDQVRRLARRRRWIEAQMTPFEQWVRDADGEWVEHYADCGVRTRFPERYQANLKRLDELGLSEVLYPYQCDDVARAAIKNRFELGSDVGTGKSITYISYVLVRNIQRAAIVCNSRLVGKWMDEIEYWRERLPHLAESLSYCVVQRLSDIGDVVDGRLVNFNRLKGVRFVIVSYESLWRVPEDSEHRGKPQTTKRKIALKPKRAGDPVTYVTREFWHPAKYSLASYLRRAFANGAILADEAYRLKDIDAKQTAAFHLLEARCRIAASATMIRNYIDDLLPILNWLYGERGVLFRRFGLWTEGEERAFVERYGTFVHYRYNDDERRVSSKMLPKIANVAEFRRWHAPMQLRRVREEPEVRRYAGAAEPWIRHESIPLSRDHRAYYEALQRDFAQWWEEYLREQKKKKREVNSSMILAKLSVLQRASTCPGMKSLTINGKASVRYEGGVTSKVLRAAELVRDHTSRGEKVVVFAQFKSSLDSLAGEIADLEPVTITGDVSLYRSKRTRKSKRDRTLASFRRSAKHGVLLATTASMTEGLDLYECSVAVFLECDWTPSVDKQALGRLRRPQQQRPVSAYFLSHAGTVDEYTVLISGSKADSHAEVLDAQAFRLQFELIPDVQDYANAVLDGLSLDEIRPARRVARIVAGAVELYNEERDGRITDPAQVERISTKVNRLARIA